MPGGNCLFGHSQTSDLSTSSRSSTPGDKIMDSLVNPMFMGMDCDQGKEGITLILSVIPAILLL